MKLNLVYPRVIFFSCPLFFHPLAISIPFSCFHLDIFAPVPLQSFSSSCFFSIILHFDFLISYSATPTYPIFHLPISLFSYIFFPMYFPFFPICHILASAIFSFAAFHAITLKIYSISLFFLLSFSLPSDYFYLFFPFLQATPFLISTVFCNISLGLFYLYIIFMLCPSALPHLCYSCITMWEQLKRFMLGFPGQEEACRHLDSPQQAAAYGLQESCTNPSCTFPSHLYM